MIRAIMAALATTAIASCNAPIGDTPLAGLDLNDARVVSKIARQLPGRDGVAFTTYALLHWPDSKTYCGQPIAQSERTAGTVGEAVTQTLQFEAELARTRQAAQASPASQIDRMREQRTRLIDQTEELVRKRDALYVRLGASAPTSAEARLLDQRMGQLRDRRAALETQLAQAARTSS